ncbi:MAG: TadE family protein [Chloroflexota bacterium]|nr:TadE family protein [Chloroflexota bacterium]
MRRLFLKLLHFLDGTPAVYGQRQSGQSLVEMALITPILIIMFMGMVEIGWFANNYMTLLDVTRSGARRAAVLQDQFSPLQWDNRASGLPSSTRFLDGSNDYTEQGLPFSGAAAASHFRMPYIDPAEAAIEEQWRWWQRSCGTSASFPPMFYQQVGCVMLTSMDPLSLDAENSIDDIVISGFSLARITDPASTNINILPRINPQAAAANGTTWIMVAGRYPTNANECEVINTAPLSGPPSFALATAGQAGAFDHRDPFDLDADGREDVIDTGDARSTVNQNTRNINERRNDVPEFDPPATTVAEAERQVGFSWFGQHWIRAEGILPNGTGCLGSEFTIAMIEQIVNLPEFQPNDLQRARLPHQGLVLVEIFWEHEMLLKFPVFNPVVGAFAGDITPTISVWAAFPMPSVEPNDAALGLDAPTD